MESIENRQVIKVFRYSLQCFALNAMEFHGVRNAKYKIRDEMRVSVYSKTNDS